MSVSVMDGLDRLLAPLLYKVVVGNYDPPLSLKIG